MDYQHVLQFKGSSLGDYDSMVALEDDLIEALGGSADVDGHDIGSGETNIFIITSVPVQTFDRAKAVLERTGLLGALSAAYRPVSGNAFTVLWPHHQQEFSVA
jgi:hypothetical protein